MFGPSENILENEVSRWPENAILGYFLAQLIKNNEAELTFNGRKSTSKS